MGVWNWLCAGVEIEALVGSPIGWRRHGALLIATSSKSLRSKEQTGATSVDLSLVSIAGSWTDGLY